MFCHLYSVPICNTQSQLGVSVTYQCTVTHCRLTYSCSQLKWMMMNSLGRLIPLFQYFKTCSIIPDDNPFRGAGICGTHLALTWSATVAKSNCSQVTDFVLLALPSGFQTNPPDRHRDRWTRLWVSCKDPAQNHRKHDLALTYYGNIPMVPQEWPEDVSFLETKRHSI